jgi:hypothetical protein
MGMDGLRHCQCLETITIVLKKKKVDGGYSFFFFF